MRTRTAVTAAAFALTAFQLACAPAPATTTTGATTEATVPVQMDPDVRPIGATGLPSGYLGRTDRPQANITDVRYAVSGSGWTVTTGPAHILYSPADTASGSYTVGTTLQQLGRPQHPEAFGIFVGGRDLEGPNQTYTYFLVRGTGEMFVQRRDGAELRNLIAWHRSQWVPEADAEGRQTYRLAIRVRPDSLHFLVNDVQAAALARDDIPAEGIAGLRINHNLMVHANPIRITRP